MRKRILSISLWILSIGMYLNAQDFEWAHTFGGTISDNGNAIAVDISGNVYTTGAFYETIDLDPGSGMENQTSLGMRDVFIQKLDADGNFLWGKAFGGTSTDSSYSIDIDPSGNVYVTGFFQETVDFDPGVGVSNLSSEGSWDIFILKLDTNGNFLWAKSIGASGQDVGYGIKVDNSGSVYTTGVFYDTVDFDPGTGIALLSTTGETTANTFILKLDSSGNYVWAKSFYGEANWGMSINLDSEENIYTTGMMTGEADFDPGAGTVSLTSVFGYGNYVQKMDNSGNFIWAKAFGGAYNYHPPVSTVDASGNVYTTGSFDFPGDYDPSDEVFTLTSNGNNDVFILKLDASGNFQWAKSFGGDCEFCADGGHSVAIDNSGNVYTTGFFSGTSDFDPGAGTASYTAVGDRDIFIQKLNPAGEFIWAQAFGGTERETSLGIDIDGENNIYTTGYFAGTLDFNPSSETDMHTSVGEWDVFVQKLSQDSLGIEENEWTYVSIYPNPVQNLLNISMSQTIDSVEIIGMDGRVYFKQNFNANEVQINLSDLPKGVYIARIQSGKTIEHKKLIKK
ncbi:SBBP repeat-containing protein [Moheibacter lacus]|uniref:SBBP repeat-containing protein n=1 Tax=Moheibacter lacus TaxID=2745851 RepID=A0A838ZUF0_9FLAO|nr:SBBP repeat-containing protein [Moheibacter lacus]MBA5630581.1 SBBP repeat-containing protein [Moheibacter lacus]